MTTAQEPTPPSADGALDVRVWRGDAGGGGFAAYAVPAQPNQTVLDVVTWIQRHREPTLSYRFACRVGMCGSCAMTVNGEPRWTCRTHVAKVLGAGPRTPGAAGLEIAPLRNLPVIKDLACDLTPFFDKWRRAEGVFRPTATRAEDTAPVAPASPARRAADAGIECINCAVCYAACDTVAWNPDYLGPAALNRAWTLHNDERDGARRQRLRAVAAAGGCHACHSQASCSAYCPNELNPTASIAGLKRALLGAALKKEL